VPVGEMAILVATGAAFLGVVSLALHWVRRASHPATAHLEQELLAAKLNITELADRLDHFMRRERVRRTRDNAATSQDAPGDVFVPPPATSVSPQTRVDPKDELRMIARQRGVLR